MDRLPAKVEFRWFKRLAKRGVLVQPVATGLLPTLYAATSPQAKGGTYYGPDGPLHLTGAPTKQAIYRAARNVADAERLWDVSERLANITFAQHEQEARLKPSTALTD